MIHASAEGRFLFCIFIHRTIKTKYAEVYRRELARRLRAFVGASDRTKMWVEQTVYEEWGPWEYNDVTGFMEIYFDGGSRSMADHFEVKARRRGRNLTRGRIYVYKGDSQLGAVYRHNTNEEIRNEIDRALRTVQRKYNRRRNFADISHAVDSLSFVDFKAYLNPGLL